MSSGFVVFCLCSVIGRPGLEVSPLTLTLLPHPSCPDPGRGSGLQAPPPLAELQCGRLELPAGVPLAAGPQPGAPGARVQRPQRGRRAAAAAGERRAEGWERLCVGV